LGDFVIRAGNIYGYDGWQCFGMKVFGGEGALPRHFCVVYLYFVSFRTDSLRSIGLEVAEFDVQKPGGGQAHGYINKFGNAKPGEV
jgi:hypothetical protein